MNDLNENILTDEKKFIIYSENKKKYELFLRNYNNEEFSININSLNELISKKYELKYNLEKFQKNRFFKIFIDIEEIMRELETKIKNSKIIEETNILYLIIPIGLTIFNEIVLEIKEIEKTIEEQKEEFKKEIESINKKLKEKDLIIENYKILIDCISIKTNETFEKICQNSKYVSQIMLYGNKFNGLIAIIKPNINNCASYFKVEESEIIKMTENKKLKDLIINDLNDKLNENNGYIIDIIINFEGFTMENDCITPTFKLKRYNIINLFKQQIYNLYKNLPLKSKNRIKQYFQALKKDFELIKYIPININF